MYPSRKAIAGLLVLALAAMVVLAAAGCGQTEIEKIVDSVPDAAAQTARQANLASIDAAIQSYWAENNKWPTDLSQLSGFLSRGIPVDPLGGQYYITMEGGQARAAVR